MNAHIKEITLPMLWAFLMGRGLGPVEVFDSST